MNKHNWLVILLLALISISSFDNAHAATPLDMPVDVRVNGCFPSVHSMCPGRFTCWVDFRYKRFGSCGCQKIYALKEKTPTPLEPGSEVARPLDDSDCILIGPVNVIMGLFHFFVLCGQASIFIGSLMIARALIKNKGMKANSSCVVLIALIINSFLYTVIAVCATLEVLGLDKRNVMYDNVYYKADSVAPFFMVFIMFESFTTWFDLWQKSTSMSKRSSKLVTVIKVILRLFVLTYATFWGMMHFELLDVTEVMTPIQNSAQWSIIALCAVTAPLISRLLCKDMSDVTNPNWKAASAIRSTALLVVLAPLVFNLVVQFFSRTGFFVAYAQHMNTTSVYTLFLMVLVNTFGWYQYLQFAHRRYMGEVPMSRISQYFGFTTIGLKGSTRASSITSRKSSAASSTTSSVSSSAEDGSVDTKGTMA